MKAISSTLCGLVAAATVSLSSPAQAEKSLELFPRTSTTTQSRPIIKKKRSIDPEDNFPINYRSGSSLEVRLEMPKGTKFSILNRRFELTDDNDNVKCFFKSSKKKLKCLNEGINGFEFISVLSYLHTKIDDNLLEGFSGGMGTVRGNYFVTNLRREKDTLLEQGKKILETLWDNIYSVIKDENVKNSLTYGSFFRDLLPRYTSDGVIDPNEAKEIQKAVQGKINEHYDSLSREDKQNIDKAVNQFISDFNNYGNNHATIRNIRAIGISDGNFLDKINYGSLSLRDWYKIFTHFEPVYELTLGDNSFKLKSDIFSRFHSRSDYFNELSYSNNVFRHGFLSFAEGIGEAHLQLQGEIHGGRSIKELFGEEHGTEFDTLELLLGYEPVITDGSLKGNVYGFVDFTTLYISGYENLIKEGDNTYGIGFTQGYVYHLLSHGQINLDLSANSFSNIIEGRVGGELVIKEKIGRRGSFYVFNQSNSKDFWYHSTAGLIFENLNVREQTFRGAFNFIYNYNGEGYYNYYFDDSTKYSLESTVKPVGAFRGGLNWNVINPFVFANMNGQGGGLSLNTSFLKSELELGTRGYLSFTNLFAFNGKLDEKTNREYQIKNQQMVDSLFPARRAVITELQQRYLSSLTGSFIETEFHQKSEKNFPHDQPTVISFGLIFAKQDTLYLRTGYVGSLDKRLSGLYGSLGNHKFSTHFSLQRENIPERKSYSTIVKGGASLSLGETQLVASGYLYPSPMAYYLEPKERDGDIVFNVSLETTLEAAAKWIEDIF